MLSCGRCNAELMSVIPNHIDVVSDTTSLFSCDSCGVLICCPSICMHCDATMCQREERCQLYDCFKCGEGTCMGCEIANVCQQCTSTEFYHCSRCTESVHPPKDASKEECKEKRTKACKDTCITPKKTQKRANVPATPQKRNVRRMRNVFPLPALRF